MSLTISDELLAATHLSEKELRHELALLLFAQERLTLAQACQVAQMNRLQFQYLVASRNLPLHYDVEEFTEDVATLHHVGRG